MVLVFAYVGIVALFVSDVATQQIYANQRRKDLYDYIVVGGGSAGAVVASRLSEDRSVYVLLLEAGGQPDYLTEIPFYLNDVLNNPYTDWNYYTEPQKDACLSQEDQKSKWHRYKGLGGGSTHNFMIYTRGAPRDFDNWAELGAKGWSYKDVLPYFKKSENNTIPELANNDHHGTNGPLTVSRLPYKNELRQAYLRAGEEMGYKTVDYNGPSQLGFSELHVTQRDGRRCSTEKAFLRPAAARPNLDILLFAHVVKVDIDSKNRWATGVVYEQGNKTHKVKARREIILSAGAIGTPQLLMLSGIGPKEHLQEIGIPLVADLPVGLNLQDHVIAGGMNWYLNESVGIVKSRDIGEKALQDFAQGKGFLSSAGGTEGTAFVNTKYQNSTDWPDIQLELDSMVVLLSLPDAEMKDVATILPVIMRPKSRGFIKLRSKNPHDAPIIDPQYFSEKEDVQVLVEGMKIAKEVMKTKVMKRYDPQPVKEAMNGICTEHDKESDDYLVCQARYHSYTDWHPCGTARMGDIKDKTTVVDPELRVKGIKGLRVADASIMPLIPTGNTNAPCIMIGEKAADMIKKGDGARKG